MIDAIIFEVAEMEGERRGSEMAAFGLYDVRVAGNCWLTMLSCRLAGGSWEKMAKKVYSFFGIIEIEAAWEFQPGEMKGTLGLPDNDVMADIINADDILADLTWSIPFSFLLQFILITT